MQHFFFGSKITVKLNQIISWKDNHHYFFPFNHYQRHWVLLHFWTQENVLFSDVIGSGNISMDSLMLMNDQSLYNLFKQVKAKFGRLFRNVSVTSMVRFAEPTNTLLPQTDGWSCGLWLITSIKILILSKVNTTTFIPTANDLEETLVLVKDVISKHVTMISAPTNQIEQIEKKTITEEFNPLVTELFIKPATMISVNMKDTLTNFSEMLAEFDEESDKSNWPTKEMDTTNAQASTVSELFNSGFDSEINELNESTTKRDDTGAKEDTEIKGNEQIELNSGEQTKEKVDQANTKKRRRFSIMDRKEKKKVKLTTTTRQSNRLLGKDPTTPTNIFRTRRKTFNAK
jgi:hypothetical protein